jgi:hypothetical protein
MFVTTDLYNFNSDREIVGFDIDQDNLLDVDFGELTIKRLKEDNPMEPVVIDDKTFKRYVGNYELSADIIIAITKTGGQLKTQITGQSEMIIFATSNNTFKLQDVDAQLIFNSNDDGGIESLTLLQGGQQIACKRMNN